MIVKAVPTKLNVQEERREKRITITIYKEEYERAIKRINSPNGRRMKTIRQSTVEPVFGTLTQFLAMRKVNTRGIQQANKVMLMAAMAYNLKKYLKFNKGKVVSMAREAILSFNLKYKVFWINLSHSAKLNF